MFISHRRLYLNSDRSRVVEESDPDAAFLLIGAGGSLDDATARQYGLIKDAPLTASSVLLAAPAPDAESGAGAITSEEKAEEKAEALPAHKAVESRENKAIFPRANPRAKKVVKRDGR
jgi:hypothetical protein